MFSLSVVAVHNPSKETFHFGVGSLPSVSELLEGMGEYLAEKYGITFPDIPNIFNACDDPVAIVDLPSSPAVNLTPDAPLIQAPPTTIARAPHSTDALAPTFFTAVVTSHSTTTSSSTNAQPVLSYKEKTVREKVLCPFCGKLQAYSNLARHLKIHDDKGSWLKCDFPSCLYNTPRKDDLDRHKENTHASRQFFLIS